MDFIAVALVAVVIMVAAYSAGFRDGYRAGCDDGAARRRLRELR